MCGLFCFVACTLGQAPVNIPLSVDDGKHGNEEKGNHKGHQHGQHHRVTLQLLSLELASFSQTENNKTKQQGRGSTFHGRQSVSS